MTYDPRQLCPRCQGDGYEVEMQMGTAEYLRCSECEGKGYVLVPEQPYDPKRDPFAGSSAFNLFIGPEPPLCMNEHCPFFSERAVGECVHCLTDGPPCEHGVRGCDAEERNGRNRCEQHNADHWSAMVDAASDRDR